MQMADEEMEVVQSATMDSLLAVFQKEVVSRSLQDTI
jgi:hypothetical protein